MDSPRRYLDRLYQAIIPGGSVTEKAVKSGIWATLINVFDRVLQLGRLLVLAKILSPKDFGLMGIALLTLAVFQRFTNLGLDAALIQDERKDVDKYLDTVWVMKLGRSLVIAVLAFFIAPYAASFFGEPRATDVIRVIAISPLLLGMQNPGVMYLQKNLEFHKQFVFTLASSVVNVIVAIAYAIEFQTVWALVFGLLAGNIATVFMSYIIHDHRPSIDFELKLAKEMYGYGKWLTLSGIMIFLITQGDDAFVGWFLGATALGFYQMAYRLSNAPATEVSHVISSVAFPTYSKVQKNLNSLRDAYFRTIRLVTLVSFPAAVGIIAIAPLFVEVVLGEEWIPIIPVMQGLAVFAAFRSIAASNGPLVDAIGRPDIATKMQIFNVAKLTLFIYPFTATWGLEGVALLLVFHAVTSNPIMDYLAIASIDGSFRRYLSVLFIPILSSVCMGGLVLTFSNLNVVRAPELQLILSIFLGVFVYPVFVLVFDHITGSEIRSELEKIVNAL